MKSKGIPGGRCFEARIPWPLVRSGNWPKGGDTVAVTMSGIYKNGLRAFAMGSISSWRGMNDWGRAHFLAANPTLVFNSLVQPEVAVEPAPACKCRTTIDLPVKGLLSAAVYRSDGTLLRTLLAGRSMDAGKVELGWDGSSDSGQAATPGSYQVRAVLNSGMHARYIASGGNPGKPPHASENPLRGWGSVWDNVLDIAADAAGIYPLWGIEEGDGVLIHADEEGNVRWRQHAPLALSNPG